MKELKRCIEELQGQLKKHRRSGLKELPTRTIFVDQLLSALGWDIRDPDEVELEYPTIDGKSVDYALKINKKPVVLLEAKALNDPLDDVKAIAQVVGYAANDGVEWCVLANGVRYKVYSSSQKAAAPEKLLFEVSIDPDDPAKLTDEQMASHLNRLSRASLAKGVLDELGEEIFNTAKVRKALDRLFAEADGAFLRVIRKAVGDNSMKPAQIRHALSRIWHGETGEKPTMGVATPARTRRRAVSGSRELLEYGEAHHTKGQPAEVVELYRALDRVCQDLAPGHITRRHLAKYVAWSQDKKVFCTSHLLRGGLRVWLKISPSEIPASVAFARDVSHIGHWGLGDVELAVDNVDHLRDAERLIRASYEAILKRG
jgi:predicted type IV restriction endonuclease/predicted transport protein